MSRREKPSAARRFMVKKTIKLMKTRRLLLVAAAMAWLCPSNAQENGVWTLEQCIDYAISHNLSVKQNENNVKRQEVQLSTARNQRLPDLNASAGESMNFGRGLTADNAEARTAQGGSEHQRHQLFTFQFLSHKS